MRTLDPLEHIRRHRMMYLPQGRSDPASLATRLAGDALLLGAGRVEISRSDHWWWVAADHDWIKSTTEIETQEFFSQIVKFPEAGENSMRSEVLLSAFANEIVTATPCCRDVLKGDVSESHLIWNKLPLSTWARVVAFRASS